MKATFDNSVQVLVQAFLNGTLEKGNCAACAVGNLVAAAKGITYTSYPGNIYGHRVKPTQDKIGKWYSNIFLKGIKNLPTPEGLAEILTTGYTVREITAIESAFEDASSAQGAIGEFSGLMAVVDVLAKIHSVDLTRAETAKRLFVKA